jgi:hypothetical protein
MHTAETSRTLAHLFAELVDGVTSSRGGFMLNTGDAGMLASLDKLSADEASHSANAGATIAAHTQHVRYGLSLMNQWAAEGGNPFATRSGMKRGRSRAWMRVSGKKSERACARKRSAGSRS